MAALWPQRRNPGERRPRSPWAGKRAAPAARVC
jgi:hypothetical protein